MGVPAARSPPSTLNLDGSWTTTGVASSSGSGYGDWSYFGSAASSSSSGSGDADNGGSSSSSAQASESYSQGWSSQYNVLSTLAADGAVTTTTTGSASGSASGSHGYASGQTNDWWDQTGDYAGGNGTSSQSEDASGLALTETMQSQWQEGHTITALPGQSATTTGGASGSSETPLPHAAPLRVGPFRVRSHHRLRRHQHGRVLEGGQEVGSAAARHLDVRL